MSKLIQVINGPNLNKLGERPAEHYGSMTLDQIIQSMKVKAESLGVEIAAFQANAKGAIVDAIQNACKSSAGIIINAGAYSHTSIAIRDALECASVPIIEVHLSNIYSREAYRQHSFVSEVADGIISGLGGKGYLLALDAIVELVA